MKLNKLSLRDRKVFLRYLKLKKHELSIYSFENIYIWRRLFDISWVLVGDSLCVFFKDKIGSFLYLPPLSRRFEPGIVKEVFSILHRLNSNPEVARIENIEEQEIDFFKKSGYVCQNKYPEYLYRRSDLAQLKGNRFRSKRSGINYFIKHYRHEYLPFSLKDAIGCMDLYGLWMRERSSRNKDSIYQGMLRDSRQCLQVLLESYKNLGFQGGIVKIDKEIKAFTFAFPLNKDTFCISYEITDLSIKGLAQFIFQQFCSELKGYKYINVMDDSGLDNLKKVKLSYHPIKLIPAYIVIKDG